MSCQEPIVYGVNVTHYHISIYVIQPTHCMVLRNASFDHKYLIVILYEISKKKHLECTFMH